MTVLRPTAAAVAAVLAQSAAAACGDDLVFPRRLEGERYTVAYVTVPSPIVAGVHFVVDFVVCTRSGFAPPDSVRVDATMPEHRHGMNYRPEVVAKKDGRYRAEGMLFHMSGRWDITFDLTSPAGTERLAGTLHLE